MKHFFRSFTRLAHEQSGISMILFALSLLMIFGFTSFVVDAGGIYLEKSRLQKALDAAVLAGAQVLIDPNGNPKATAKDIAAKNGFTVEDSEIEVGADYVEINKTVNKNLTFARVLGFNDADVPATARAELSSLSSGEGIVPIGILQNNFVRGESYILNAQPGNSHSPGNFGFLGIDGNGGNVLREAIMNGTKRKVLEEFEWTEPGTMAGPVRQGFEYRINQDAGKEHCQSHETANSSCSRVIITPIVESYEDATGRSMVRITGFAAFWVESAGNHEVRGRFIDVYTNGTAGPGQDFGVNVVKLVK